MNELIHWYASLHTQIWAMAPRYLEALLASGRMAIESPNAASMFADHPENIFGEKKSILQVSGDTGTIPVNGVILRNVPWFARLLVLQVSGVDHIQAAVTEAIANEDVKKLALAINSPGGTTSGLAELEQVVFGAREKLETFAHANGLMASAAFGLGVQAEHVSASPGSLIGSIGAFTVMSDSSELAKSLGVKVHVVRSAPLKGLGEPGAEVTKRDIESLQRIVDKSHKAFVGSVARARGMSVEEVEKLADGDLWTSDEAVQNKTIDRVVLSDEATQLATKQPDSAPAESGEDMTAEKNLAPADNDINERLNALEAQNKAHANENAELKAKLQKMETQAEADAAVIANQEAQKKTDLIEEAVKDGRILPSARGSFDALVPKMSFEEIEGIIGGLESKTNPTRIGSDSKQLDDDNVVDAKGRFSAEDVEILATTMNISEEEVLKSVKELDESGGKKKREAFSVVNGRANVDFRELPGIKSNDRVVKVG